MNKKLEVVSVYLVCILVVLSLLGTMGISCKQSEDEAVEKVIQQFGGDEVKDVDFKSDSEGGSLSVETSGGKIDMVTGSKAQWPSEAPGFVPRMDGDLVSIQTISDTDAGPTGKSYTALYENIKDDKDSYMKKLESNGWNIMMELDLGDEGWSIQAEHAEGWGIIAQGDENKESGVLSFFPN